MAVVVKVGGSIFRDALVLERVCAGLAGLDGPCVVVAGGGVFADCVRAEQVRHRFDDVIAHRMALLSMEQNGHVLCAQVERAVGVSSFDGFDEVWERGGIPVWKPFAMCDVDSALAQDWSVTSDAIAARLGERLSGARVVLLKSCRVEPAWGLDDLAARGIVDPAFCEIVARASLRFRVVGDGDGCALVSAVGELQERST